MSSSTIEIHRPAPSGRTRVDPRRRGLGSGRRNGPWARPTHAVPAPTLTKPQRSTVQACRLERTAAARLGWRLTDRGIAVIMVVGMMIVTAALSVVGLTALRVISTDYPALIHAASGQG